MSVAPLPPRRLVLHVGTHKTGTKALQIYLAANRLQLALTGVHYPLAGRQQFEGGSTSPGHQQIALDFASEGGSASFAAVVNEIRSIQAATVILSSERLLALAQSPGVLETIVATGRELGYGPVAIVVLRSQPDYLESMYAQIATTSTSSFTSLVEEAITNGHIYDGRHSVDLTYTKTISRLEEIFGAGNVVVRAYRPDRGLQFGRADFLSIVSLLRGGLRLCEAADPLPSVNERWTLRALLTNITRARGTGVDLGSLIRRQVPDIAEAELDRPFLLIDRADRLRFFSRFAAGNRAINERFGIEIPFVAESGAEMSDADDRRARAHRTLVAAVFGAMEGQR